MSLPAVAKFLFPVAFLLLASPSMTSAQEKTSSATGRPVNAERLRQSLEKLSEFGRNPDGGVTRLGFSEADMAAREYVMGLMRAAGLIVRVDPAGNIFGHREGTEKLPVLLFGSHIDSVLHGGNFDGDVGSMGAIEVMRALNDNHVTTRHPLEAVIWTNEEGNHFGLGTFGSSAASGKFGPEVLARRGDDGLTLADWLRRYGQDPARFAEARIAPGALAGYLELHIEQGGVLDEAHIPIGVVQGIVGIRHWRCVATGFANHAGTTPMNRRQDALAAVARAALAVRDEVRAEPGRQVGTVGYMKIEPGSVNVIPGHVEFPVELRDLDAAKIERIWNRVEKRFAEIGKEENVDIHCALDDTDDPASSEPEFRAVIRKAAEEAGLATMDLPSGAGHDAMMMASITDIGMLFVRCKGGISHNPAESVEAGDVGVAIDVLGRFLELLAKG